MIVKRLPIGLFVYVGMLIATPALAEVGTIALIMRDPVPPSPPPSDSARAALSCR